MIDIRVYTYSLISIIYIHILYIIFLQKEKKNFYKFLKIENSTILFFLYSTLFSFFRNSFKHIFKLNNDYIYLFFMNG